MLVGKHYLDVTHHPVTEVLNIERNILISSRALRWQVVPFNDKAVYARLAHRVARGVSGGQPLFRPGNRSLVVRVTAGISTMLMLKPVPFED